MDHVGRIFIVILFVGLFGPISNQSYEEIELNDQFGWLSNTNATNENSSVIWHLNLTEVCEIDLHILNLTSDDECDYVAVAGGPKVLNASKVFLLTGKHENKKIRVVNHEAYIIPFSQHLTLGYRFFFNCSIGVIDALNMSVIPTPFTAPPNETLAICISNLNASYAHDFMEKDSTTQSDFLRLLNEMASDAYNQIHCAKGTIFEAHIHWPIYMQYDCGFSDKTLPITNRYCVCFNFSMEVVDEKIKNTKCGPRLSKDQLEDVIDAFNRKHNGKPYLANKIKQDDPVDLDVIIPSVFAIIIIAILIGAYLLSNYLQRDETLSFPLEESEDATEEKDNRQNSIISRNNPIYVDQTNTQANYQIPDDAPGAFDNEGFEGDLPPDVTAKVSDFAAAFSATGRTLRGPALSKNKTHSISSKLRHIQEEEDEDYAYASCSPNTSDDSISFTGFGTIGKKVREDLAGLEDDTKL